jgi:hypothetical protein
LNINDKRKSERYSISEYIKEDSYKDICLEIRADRIYKPVISDISINGLGYELIENDLIILEEVSNLENFYININFQNKSVLVEVKKIWNTIIKRAGKRTLTGGVFFSVISPGDRLAIAEYINYIRN